MDTKYFGRTGGRWILIALLVVFAIKASPANTGIAAPKATVSFRTTKGGFILVDASFGKGATYTFLVDSGLSIPAILDRNVAIEAHLKQKDLGVMHLLGNSSDVSDTSDWREATITQRNVALIKGIFPTTDFSALSKTFETPIAGIIGVAILSRYVVEIDYSAGRLIFFEPKNFQYKGDGQVIPLEDIPGISQLIVKAQAELPNCRILPIRVSIDTGADGDIDFNHLFHEAHPDLGGQDIASGSVALSGKSMDASLGNFRSIKIGTYSLLSPHTSILRSDTTEALDRVTDGRLGSEMLSQFTIFVDYPDGKIILEPRVDKPLTLAPGCGS